MPHPRIPGFAALKRANKLNDQEARPEIQEKGISLVESLSLRGVTTEKTSGLRIVNNSPGGGRQENVVAKVPGLEGTYAAVIDNQDSLLEAYRMMTRGRLSVIFAVPPNGSGASMTTAEIPWSVLKASEEAAPSQTEEKEKDDEEDSATIVADDETVIGDDESTGKVAKKAKNEASPQKTTANHDNQPGNDADVPYPDLAGLVI